MSGKEAEITVSLSDVFMVWKDSHPAVLALAPDGTMQPVNRTLQVKIPKGLPKRNGATGDIIVELEERIPDSLSVEEERILLQLSSISTFTPRTRKTQRAGKTTSG